METSVYQVLLINTAEAGLAESGRQRPQQTEPSRTRMRSVRMRRVVRAALLIIVTTFLVPAALGELVTVEVGGSSSEPLVFDSQEDWTAVAERYAERHGLERGAGCEDRACVVSQLVRAMRAAAAPSQLQEQEQELQLQRQRERSSPGRPLIAPPLEFVQQLEELSVLDSGELTLSREEAIESYLRMLASMLTSHAFSCDISRPRDKAWACLTPFATGRSIPRVGVTMCGVARLHSIRSMIRGLASSGTPGAYLEAGVWRGGVSIFVAAAMQLYGVQRKLYLADSFAGLPRDTFEDGYVSMNATLAVSSSRVRRNFERYGVSQQDVELVPGYFNESMAPLRAAMVASGERLSILRLDADQYGSTAEVLYSLYDRLSVGGYVIMDDFGWGHGAAAGSSEAPQVSWGAKAASLDFRAIHGIEDDEHLMHDIDGFGAWWRKSREVSVQLDRLDAARGYRKTHGTLFCSFLQPEPHLTGHDYSVLQAGWEAGMVREVAAVEADQDTQGASPLLVKWEDQSNQGASGSV